MALPYIIDQISKSKMSNPVTFTGSISSLPSIGVELSQITDLKFSGNTVNVINTNGNFANGTTGWVAVNSTLSASNNILSVAGNGGSVISRVRHQTSVKPVIGKKIYFSAKLKVTNSNCTSMYAVVRDGVSGNSVIVQTISNPVANTVYKISGVISLITEVNTNIDIQIDHVYADAATANGKVMEVQEVMAIDMGTSGELYNLTTTDMNTRFPTWLKYGVVSTDCGFRLKSNGKNKCPTDIANWEQGTISSSTGNNLANTTSIRTKSNVFYPIPQGIISLSQTTGYTLYCAYYDNGKNYINMTDGINRTVPTNAVYCRYRISYATDITPSIIPTAKPQCELGSTATTYEPFISGGEIYTPPIGKSLPNGVKDEVSVTIGVKTQKIASKVLQTSDVTGVITTFTNIDYALVSKPIDALCYGNITSGGSTTLEGYTEINGSLEDLVENVGKFSARNTNTAFRVGITKGTTLVQAQTALVGKTLNYQLLEKRVTQYPPQILLGYPNGTLILEPIIQEFKTTNGEGILLKSSVKSIESIKRIDGESKVDIPSTDISTYRFNSTKTAESGTDTVTIKITNHGLTVNDRIVNVTRNNTVRKVLTVVDANTFTINAITSQTNGDTIQTYKTTITDVLQPAIINVANSVSGQEYIITYEYDSSLSTLPTVEYKYAMNIKSVVESNTKTIAQHSELIRQIILSSLQ